MAQHIQVPLEYPQNCKQTMLLFGKNVAALHNYDHLVAYLWDPDKS